MARNFYFGADATMVSGSAMFSARINDDAAAYGLTEAQALAYSEINATLQAAYHAATTPSTRTSVAVSEKNAAMKAMQRAAKGLADIIRATPSVTDAQLMTLGLLPRPQRTRRHVPDTAPVVRVISVVGRVVTIRVCDPNSSTGRSKAAGARGAMVWSYVGEEPPTDSRAYDYQCFTTRTTAQITFSGDVASGATVWLCAWWVSARGENSVASSPISFTLQGGRLAAATPQLMNAAA